MQLHILNLYAIYFPESLVSISNLYVLELQIIHLTEKLRPIDARVLHHHIIGIPNGRA